uniref:Ovule protein n=2 Tax=Macrostomum lignano TaxID=282301 RepID=A0A1I8JIX0_9PLAT
MATFESTNRKREEISSMLILEITQSRATNNCQFKPHLQVIIWFALGLHPDEPIKVYQLR